MSRNKQAATRFGEVTIPAVSAAGESVIVMDAADSRLKVSENGSAFAALRQPGVHQIEFAELTADDSTNSATFVELLSITMTFEGGTEAKCEFTCSFNDSGAGNTEVSFEYRIDGAPIRATAATSKSTPESCALVHRSGILAAGAHTFAIFWKVSAGTAQIQPVTQSDSEHASLIIEEFSV